MEADYIEFNVRQQLPLGIAEQIYENLDMPIFDIQEVYIPQQHQTRYLLRINIISQAELNRLRDIERKYNSIQSPFER
jgi:hypothetical protein